MRWHARGRCCAPSGRSAIGEGERRIPACGRRTARWSTWCSPIHRVAAYYEDDFRLFPDAAGPCGSDRHRSRRAGAAGRAHGQFRAVLSRRVRLHPEQLWEISDPYGLVRSRTMVSPERSVRLPLNISESRETGTGRFLTTYAGAGVQHIAMATEDIFDTLNRLVARGARILPIPANYYDDMAAKWGLEDVRIAAVATAQPAVRLRRERRIPARLYRHIRRPVLLRNRSALRRQYEQYGAANAAVRMAAQAQRHRDITAERVACVAWPR